MIILTFWSKVFRSDIDRLVSTRDSDQYCGASTMAFNESSSEIYKAPNFCIGVYPDSAEPPTAPEYAGAVLLAAGENINEPPKRLAENQDWLRSRKFEDAGAPAGTTDELCAMLEGRTVDEIIETIAKWMREP